MGGVLYHANYFTLYEKAREALLKSIDFPYDKLTKENIHLAIFETSQKFHEPIFYGNNITLKLNAKNIRSASFELIYEIFHATNGKKIHEAATRHVIVHTTKKDLKPIKIPAKLRLALKKIEIKIAEEK